MDIPEAVTLIESDPLLRLLVAQAIAGAGLRLGCAGRQDDEDCVAFVGLDDLEQCTRCRPTQPSPPVSQKRLLRIGYGAGPQALLRAHMRHRCCDLFVSLQAVDGRASFVHPDLGLSHGRLPEDLTEREADVLVCLLHRLSDAGIAGRLTLSPATVRSHRRAVLRKLEAPDAKSLRARLLDARRESGHGGARWLGTYVEERCVQSPSAS